MWQTRDDSGNKVESETGYFTPGRRYWLVDEDGQSLTSRVCEISMTVKWLKWLRPTGTQCGKAAWIWAMHNMQVQHVMSSQSWARVTQEHVACLHASVSVTLPGWIKGVGYNPSPVDSLHKKEPFLLRGQPLCGQRPPYWGLHRTQLKRCCPE